MQRVQQVPTLAAGALRFLDILRATIVHSIRRETGGSALGFVSALLRPLVLLATFWIIIEVMGVRGIAIRGNTVTFLLTGILPFLVHVETVTKVSMAVRKARSMLHHAPASIFVYVLAQALATLYLNLAAAILIWTVAELSGAGLGLRDPAGLMAPYMLAWLSGLGVGLVFLVIGHVAPTAAQVASTVYTRLQFFTCGKFWAANIMPPALVDYAVWNPLLHIIDQIRGAAFVNYTPQHTSLDWPVAFAIGSVVFGFMLEDRLRKGFSVSHLRR